MCSEVWQMHGTVCNYTLIYAHLNGIYQGWGVIATTNGIVYQPPWTFRPSCNARRLPIDTCLVSKKLYKSPLTNYDFGVAIGGLLLRLQNFKKVNIYRKIKCAHIWTQNNVKSGMTLWHAANKILPNSAPMNFIIPSTWTLKHHRYKMKMNIIGVN